MFPFLLTWAIIILFWSNRMRQNLKIYAILNPVIEEKGLECFLLSYSLRLLLEKHAQEDEKSLEPVHALLPRVNMSHHQHPRSFPFWLLPITTTPQQVVAFVNHGLLFTLLPCTSPVVWQKSWRKISNVIEVPQIYQKLFWFCTLIFKNTSCNSLVLKNNF